LWKALSPLGWSAPLERFGLLRPLDPPAPCERPACDLRDPGAVKPEPRKDRVRLGVLQELRRDAEHNLARSLERVGVGDAISLADQVRARTTMSQPILGRDDKS
jgi:hypothetical protein